MRYLIGIYCFLWIPLWAHAQGVETVFVSPSKTFSQEPYLRFDPFTIEHPRFKKAYSKELRVKDKEGYLWFVADNNTLIRYDGTHARIYDDKTYYGVRCTPTGVVWSATEHGMLLYDAVSEKFNIYTTPLIKNYSIWGDANAIDGKIYVLFPATDNNVRSPLFEFDTQTQRFRHIQLPPITNGYTHQVESDTSVVYLKPLAVDAQGRVWGHISWKTKNQLGYYDPATHKLLWFPLQGAYAPDFNGDGYPYQNLDLSWVIFRDSQVWVGGWFHTGLLCFDTNSLQWKQYYFPQLETNRVLQAQVVDNQRFIFHSDGPLSIFDIAKGTLHQYPHIPDDRFSPASNPNCIFKTGANEFWIGKQAANGDPTVYFLNATSTYFRTIPTAMLYPNTKVLGKYGSLLFYHYKTKESLILANYDETTHKTTLLFQEPLLDDFEGFNAMLPDTLNKTVWIIGKTPSGCIWQWDVITNKIKRVSAAIENTTIRTDQIDDIWSLTQDHEGNVWFPVFRLTKNIPQNALIKYDSHRKAFLKMPIGETENGGRVVRYRSLLFDHRGLVWIGTQDDNRIRWYDPKTHQLLYKNEISKSSTLTNQAISNMVEDHKRGVVWIAAGSLGLWKYTFLTDKWQKVQMDAKEGITSIRLMKDGTLWIKGYNTLIRYKPATNQVKYLDNSYDLKTFDRGALVKSFDDEELFFEKFRFYSHEIPDDTLKPTIVFSFINVFDQPLSTNLNVTPSIRLRYNQNFFSVGFSLLSYIQREKNQYYYRLVGFNDQWVAVGNSPFATFTNVPAGTYTLQIKGSNFDGISSEIKSIKITITPPFWQTAWFIALVSCLFVAMLVVFYRYRLAQQTLLSRLNAEEAFRKQQEAEYQQRIAQTEIAALRAQMNPHFIFNCLNSIQFYAANNEAEAASDYLTKFSRLIRLVLENSRSEKVTLTNELETLRLYIEMEAMRFGKKLNYQINISPDIDTDTLQIPPLLIQPFVENAIWHGLMHKPQGGKVTIDVQQPKDNLLQIGITDDGIGREKASEIKSKSATKQKSFGMKVTAERIQLINQLYQTHTHIEIIDLKDNQGKALGTKVRVKIPL